MTAALSHHDRPPLLAVDPGREKCGIAVMTFGREVLDRAIIATEDLSTRIAYYIGRYGVGLVVMGDRTGGRDARNALRRAGFRLEIIFVDEDRSSEMGRRRYLLDHPPTGWRRLLPLGLREPDRPYDDYVAVILAERYLDGSRSTRIRKSRVR